MNLIIGAGEKMQEDFRVRDNGMFAHSVDPHLQLFQTGADKIFFKSAYSRHSRQTTRLQHRTTLKPVNEWLLDGTSVHNSISCHTGVEC